MHCINIKKNEDRLSVVSEIAGFLQAGKVAVLPTDTIYGLSCLADDLTAINKIYKLKYRQPNKPLIILVSSLSMARHYVRMTASQADLAAKFWQESRRPTTLIFFDRGRLSFLSGSLALRLPKSSLLIKIIRKIGRPIVSTSLNISGQEEIKDLSQIDKFWPNKDCQPDLVVNNGRSRTTKPSRLIDLRGPKPVVLRK